MKTNYVFRMIPRLARKTFPVVLSITVMSSVTASPPKLELDLNGSEVGLSWATENGSYYFVQQSETLEAGSWTYHDFAAKGDGAAASTAADGSPARQFFRLEFYDGTELPLPEALTGDFDSDQTNNKTELDQGTDVFGLTFSDPDSLSDEWEFSFFGDLAQDDTRNDDADFTNNLEEHDLGLDPTLDETGLALSYVYDDAGRLTAVGGNSTTLAYTLDEEGNITLAE